MTPSDELSRVVEGYAGKADDLLERDLSIPGSEASRALQCVRTIAAAPLSLRGLDGVDAILAWEAAQDEAADWQLDLEDPVTGLQQLATLASERAHSDRRPEAIELLRRAARMALVHLGEEHRDTSTYVNGLARLYYQAGDYETAGRGFERAVEMRTLVMGPAHTDTAISLTGLARVREAQGRYTDAVALHVRALAIFESRQGSDHPDTALNLNDLGCALQAIGESAEARTLFERALAINREFEGPSSRNVAVVLGNLGGVLVAEGSLDQAHQIYLESLAIIEATGDRDDSTYRWALNNLACVKALVGDSAQARDLCEQALSLPLRDAMEDRLTEAAVRNNLGMAYQTLGDSTAAESQYQSALAMLRQLFGLEHPLICAIRVNVARCLREPLSERMSASDAEWAAFRAAFGSGRLPMPLCGEIGVWCCTREGLSLPVMMTLAA
jgi:tetratricopeptide (TPR) repeat protein